MSKREIILSVLVAIALAVFLFMFFNRDSGSGMTVISPKEGDVWQAGQAHQILWSGEGEKVSIFLIDQSLEPVGQSAAISWRVDGLDNTGSYEFTVPAELKTGNYKISVSSDVSGSSSGYFKIENSLGNTSSEDPSVKDPNSYSTYSDSRFGFSMSIPKTAYSACMSPSGESGKIVPITVFESASIIYVAPARFPDALNNCELTDNHIGLIEERNISPVWRIYARHNIATDEDINAFLKERYGACGAIKDKSLVSDDTYKIALQENQTSGPCSPAHWYFIRHNTVKNVIVNWDLGQNPTFLPSGSSISYYDAEMVNSFRFN